MDAVSDGINPAFQQGDDAANGFDTKVPDGEYAITVRRAQIQYKDILGGLISGGAPKTNVVLKDFNMTVKTGHIYGLLGASGCGKTSILRAIVGRLNLTAGDIRVLGHRPNTPKSGIPGTTIGYMPQDLCLLEELTIKESLYFYGKLGGLSFDEIDAKCEYYVKLLELPKSNRIVGTLSGGQRRRVSFAIALVHSPPILILDEPTVGVDPLLRESIWQYLNKCSRSNRITVLITTHYIEEASLADTVGLMRHGKIMAEQSPRSLMQSLRCNSLEDVLLKLCVLQSKKKRSVTSDNHKIDFPDLPMVNDGEAGTETKASVSKEITSWQRIQVLTWKDTLLLLRHYWFLFFVVVLPTICMVLFCLAVGGIPRPLKISIYNQESNCFRSGPLLPNFHPDGNSTTCDMPSFLSCRVIAALQELGSVTPVVSESGNSAENDVRKGRSWAAMTFPKNFTSSFMKRAQYSSLYDVEEVDIDMGTIQVVMDQSDRIVSNVLQQQMVIALKRVLSDVNDVCNNLKHAKDLPMQFNLPVYGNDEASFLDYTMPGGVASIVMMFPCVTTLATMLPGKLQGTLERGLIVGVKMSEVIISLFFVCLTPSVLITAGAVGVPYVIFGQTMIGSYWTIAGITVPMMISGMLLGFVISLLSKTVTAALLATTFFWFSSIFTSGAMWPVQGAYPFVQPIFWSLPMTLPIDALRKIALRGWTLGYNSLQLSLTSIGIWTLVYLAAISILLRFNIHS